MATRILAFATIEPTPDVRRLYEDVVIDYEIDPSGDEVCISFDPDDYSLSGFDEENLVVKKEKTSLSGTLAKMFVRKYIVSVPIENALDSTYIPDALVLENGTVLEDAQDGQWDGIYREALETSSAAFVTFCYNHT